MINISEQIADRIGPGVEILESGDIKIIPGKVSGDESGDLFVS